jgi:predicted membrane-bound mannosyltransferase
MLLALFTAAFLFALLRVSIESSVLGWASAGVAAAAMLATKESGLIALTAAGLPFVAFVRPRLSGWLPVAFTVTLVLLINPILLLQSYSAYWQRGIYTIMHHHPAYYYLGLVGREAIVVATAVVGFFMPAPHRFTRVLKWYALLSMAMYSAIPYKTPWIGVNLIFGLALLAGIGIPRVMRKARFVTGSLVLAGVAHLVWQSYTASFLRPADPSNPWVYAQTGSGVFAIRDAVLRYDKDVSIGIYTRENLWPLPWYLRRNKNVRWSREVVLEGAPPPLVIASPEMEIALQKKFYEGPPPGQREIYMNLFREPVYLRPGVEIRGYVRKSLWDKAER